MFPFPHRHLLAIEGLEPPYIADLLDLAENYALLNRQGKTQRDLLRGRTLINLFLRTAPAPAPASSWRASGWAPTS